jgi:hypothetical protein
LRGRPERSLSDSVPPALLSQRELPDQEPRRGVYEQSAIRWRIVGTTVHIEQANVRRAPVVPTENQEPSIRAPAQGRTFGTHGTAPLIKLRQSGSDLDFVLVEGV